MAHFYDDPEFTYTDYWAERAYEHRSELLAFNTLLQGKRFKKGVDIGGGYGRILPHLSHFCRKLTLIEPSIKQRKIAKGFLKSIKDVTIASGTSHKTHLETEEYDLIIMIRVMHHLPSPDETFQEIRRLLSPKGVAIIEFANALNFKARLDSLVSGRPILPTPVERRSIKNIQRESISFVNHHPLYIKKLLARHGLQIVKVISVSNLRSPFLKKVLPLSILVGLEQLGQKLLSWAWFGPSIFVEVVRVDNI